MTINSELSHQQIHNLHQAAKLAAQKAYAPYSNFRVGAAVLRRTDIFVGANIENASYGLSICAERVALSKAVTEGDGIIHAIAIACIDAKSDVDPQELMPCGACRQWIAELAPESSILIVGYNHVFRLTELMPLYFRLKH